MTIRVLNPDGEQRGRFGGLGRGPERFGGQPSAAGTYTVELIVAGDDEDASGDYEITLLRHETVATDPKKLTDQMMARFDGDHSPGAAVRVWRDGKTLYSKTYGMANLAYGIPFEADTRTNIGSTSKQFTAFAIMLQAERGLLSLDDDIRTHIPELPEFDETIRVRHLVTHTSGLREFLNLLRMTGRRLDRGDWIDRTEIIEIVQRQPALQNVPGGEWNYNNTAYGLAAVIVERTSGQDFHVFMQDNVFGPLGMTGTMVRPSIRHIVPDNSEGYTPTPDGYSQIGDLGGAVGAGGMYSTLADLQTWVENFANPRVGTRESIDEMMTSFVLNDGEETGYGYGLFIDEQGGLRRVHHGGADVAHRSMLVYYPEINAGITTQSNHAQFNSNMAYELAEAFFREEMEDGGRRGGGDRRGGGLRCGILRPGSLRRIRRTLPAGRGAHLHPHLHARRRDAVRAGHGTGAPGDRPDLGLDVPPAGRRGLGDLPARRGRRGRGRDPAPERGPARDPDGRRRGPRGVDAHGRRTWRTTRGGSTARSWRRSTRSRWRTGNWSRTRGGLDESRWSRARRRTSPGAGSLSRSSGIATAR